MTKIKGEKKINYNQDQLNFIKNYYFLKIKMGTESGVEGGSF